MKKFSTKDMVITALMIAFGIMIPTLCKPLQVVLPPAFTATILAHVPIFISMFISPISAIFTAIGTTIGFFFTGTPFVVVVRAASHIVFAIVGAFMIKKEYNLLVCGLVTAILHAFFEAVVVYAFLALGITEPKSGVSFVEAAFYTTGIGTLIHHIIDYIIAVIIIKSLVKAKMLKNVPKLI